YSNIAIVIGVIACYTLWKSRMVEEVASPLDDELLQRVNNAIKAFTKAWDQKSTILCDYFNDDKNEFKNSEHIKQLSAQYDSKDTSVIKEDANGWRTIHAQIVEEAKKISKLTEAQFLKPIQPQHKKNFEKL